MNLNLINKLLNTNRSGKIINLIKTNIHNWSLNNYEYIYIKIMNNKNFNNELVYCIFEYLVVHIEQYRKMNLICLNLSLNKIKYLEKPRFHNNEYTCNSKLYNFIKQLEIKYNYSKNNGKYSIGTLCMNENRPIILKRIFAPRCFEYINYHQNLYYDLFNRDDMVDTETVFNINILKYMFLPRVVNIGQMIIPHEAVYQSADDFSPIMYALGIRCGGDLTKYKKKVCNFYFSEYMTDVFVDSKLVLCEIGHTIWLLCRYESLDEIKYLLSEKINKLYPELDDKELAGYIGQYPHNNLMKYVLSDEIQSRYKHLTPRELTMSIIKFGDYAYDLKAGDYKVTNI